MTFKYLYQDRSNANCEGEIEARTRDEAYTKLRKRGIRPYRVIGDDPWNWRPWAIAGGYAVLLAALVVAVIYAVSKAGGGRVATLPPEEATAFRARAAEAVERAPETFRYNVWKGVNARLAERGLEPLPRPEGLPDEDDLESRF